MRYVSVSWLASVLLEDLSIKCTAYWRYFVPIRVAIKIIAQVPVHGVPPHWQLAGLVDTIIVLLILDYTVLLLLCIIHNRFVEDLCSSRHSCQDGHPHWWYVPAYVIMYLRWPYLMTHIPTCSYIQSLISGSTSLARPRQALPRFSAFNIEMLGVAWDEDEDPHCIHFSLVPRPSYSAALDVLVMSIIHPALWNRRVCERN